MAGAYIQSLKHKTSAYDFNFNFTMKLY